MDVGRSAPRYHSIALLYPQSKQLQSQLSEYFIVVVRLCHQVVKFTQKSALGQFTSSLSDSELGTYQSSLALWANSIKEEVNLLMARKIEEEAKDSSRFRSRFSKGSELASYQKKLKSRLRILDRCSKYDFETTWKQIRKVGTATLYQRLGEYEDWKSRETSSTLLFTGKLG
jgi:hypothetical protein